MQHFVVLGHVPGQYTRRDVQEVQILLEVVENVANDFLLIVAIDVVGLATAAQEYLGAVVMLLLVVVGAAHFRVGKIRAQVLAQAHLVDEVELIRLVYLQIHPTIFRVALCLGWPALVNQRIA